MVRMVISALIYTAANAIGLLVAAAVHDDMTLDARSFLIEVVIFTVVEVLMQPLLTQAAVRHSRALLGGSALIATLIALVVTTVVSDGLSISGALTWVMATVIVWAASFAAGLLLPVVFVKRAATTARPR